MSYEILLLILMLLAGFFLLLIYNQRLPWLGERLGMAIRRYKQAHKDPHAIFEHERAGPIDFRDPTNITQWLKFFLYALIAIDLIALFSAILQYNLLSDFKIGVYSSQALAIAAAESNDKRQQVIGFFDLGIFAATSFLFAMWIYRANFNARQLGAQGMQFSPGWSIGYYFIPLLSLWKPYQAMKEIWQASKNPTSWATVERGSILPWWWFFFLAECMMGQAILRTSLQAKEINEMIGSTGIAIASDLVSIPATIIAIVLVKQIYEMQMSHVQGRIGTPSVAPNAPDKPAAPPQLTIADSQKSEPEKSEPIEEQTELLSITQPQTSTRISLENETKKCLLCRDYKN